LLNSYAAHDDYTELNRRGEAFVRYSPRAHPCAGVRRS
jgi:hypothetical protein